MTTTYNCGCQERTYRDAEDPKNPGLVIVDGGKNADHDARKCECRCHDAWKRFMGHTAPRAIGA